MGKKDKRRKNPIGLKFTPPDLRQFASYAMDQLILQELRSLTVEQKTFVLALLPKLKLLLETIPKEKLAEMTPETIITIH